jgi:AraC-like DNA-binding protein
MRVRILPPSETLAGLIRHFTIVETSEEATRTLVPDTGVILGVRYGGAARELHGAEGVQLPDATLAGVRGTARRLNTSVGGGVVLATFHEGAAAAFIRPPLHELFGATAPLEDLFRGQLVASLLSRVGEAGTDAARVAAVETFLLEQRRSPGRDPLVAVAVRLIKEARGGIRVDELARRFGLSRDRLEKRFRGDVGASPKRFGSLVRLRFAVSQWRPGRDLTEVALDAGYFDQPHFNREFKQVLGQAPRQFFERRAHC